MDFQARSHDFGQLLIAAAKYNSGVLDDEAFEQYFDFLTSQLRHEELIQVLQLFALNTAGLLEERGEMLTGRTLLQEVETVIDAKALYFLEADFCDEDEEQEEEAS